MMRPWLSFIIWVAGSRVDPLNGGFKVNATLFQCLLIGILHHQKLGWPQYLGQDSQSKKVGWRRDLLLWITISPCLDLTQVKFVCLVKYFTAQFREHCIFRRSCGIVLSRSTALVQLFMVVTLRKSSNIWQSYEKFLSMWLIHRGNIHTTILK